MTFTLPELPVNISQALDQIKQSTKADVRFDDVSRLLYASDASIYQKIPFAVIYPRSESDCSNILQIINSRKIPLIARAGGTSLAGQVVGEALILDFSRYMTGIVAIDSENKLAVVNPGLIVSELNEALKEANLMFAPDPSTLTRATISGLIGNNAWGAHSPLYGETVDNIISLRVALATGEIIEVGPMPDSELESKLASNEPDSAILNVVTELLEENKKLLSTNYPIQQVPNNVGYALDKLIKLKPWNPQGENFNLVPLICGSEGTLGIVTQIKLKLVQIPGQRLMMVVNFDSLLSAVSAVSLANKCRAVAVELLDEVLLGLIAEGKSNFRWQNGETKAVLLIEFQADSPDQLNKQSHDFVRECKAKFSLAAITFLNTNEIIPTWNLRRSALGMLMGRMGDKKAVSFVEDSAVAVQYLPEFVSDIQTLMNSMKTECVYYGSVSRGLFHLRPLLDLKLDSDREKLVSITQSVIQILRKYSGSLSAKHGDGLVRGGYIENQVGTDMYKIMRKIKTAFDPDNILNLGKLFDTPRTLEDLRHDCHTKSDSQIISFYDWNAQGGLLSAVEKCNGSAVCRRRSGGAMCPSYQATLEEKNTTRGRANIFRQVLQMNSGDVNGGVNRGEVNSALADDRLHEVLKLCLSCKACIKDCPAGVNMARLKSEHLHHYYSKHARPLLMHLLVRLEKLNGMASLAPGLFNVILQSGWIKRLLKIHPDRMLPTLNNGRLAQWFNSRNIKDCAENQPRVIIVNDVFNEFYDVDVAKKAILSLEKLGYAVTLSPLFPSLRISISQGMIDKAKESLDQSLTYFYHAAKDGTPIIGLEPSELLSYRDEIFALLFDDEDKRKAQLIADNAFLFDEFIVQHITENGQPQFHWPDENTQVRVHTHCHQKSLASNQTFSQCLSEIPNMTVEDIDSGCCGMAGFFGYEKENYVLSQQIGNMNLFPAIRKAPINSIVVAAGFSCRHQIADGVGVKTLHPAEVIYKALV